MKTIHILEVESGNEAHAIRAAAECWEADVAVTWVGNSAQIVDYLSRSPSHDLIIIPGHGEPTALLLLEFHESVGHRYPYNERITADQFREFVKLKGTPVLNCSGGLRRPYVRTGVPLCMPCAAQNRL